jgi:hypothetical protein
MTLKQFLRFHLKRTAGHSVEFKLVHALYRAACEGETPEHHRVKFSRAIHAAGYQTGIANNNRVRVLNCSVDPTARPKRRLTLRRGKSPARRIITK